MPNPIYPFINGNRSSWAEIEFRIQGVRNIGVQGLDYAPSQDPQYVYGAGVEPVGRTRGQVKPEASMTLLKEEFNLLIDSLAKQGQSQGLGYGEVTFDIQVSYRLDGLGNGTTQADSILGCRITKPAQAVSQGSDGLSVKVDLNPMRVLIMGKGITGKGFA